MRVLLLTYRVPYPPTDGGSMAVFTTVKGLSENGCSIDLVSINTPKHSQPKGSMEKWAHQYDIFVDTSIRPVKLLMNVLFSSIPYNVSRFVSKNVAKELKERLQSTNYDYIQVEGAFVAAYVPLIKRFSSCPLIIRPHNIEYIIWKRLGVNERNPLKKWFFNHLSSRLLKFEAKYYNLAYGIAAITPEDKERLIQMNVKPPISVIPVGTELEKFSSIPSLPAKQKSIFILGALDWRPNVEGLNWFMENIWSVLHKNDPSIELHIAGKSTPDHIMKWQLPNVNIHGFVDDAVTFMNSYQIMLVPLLSGGGMRVKIIEGMAAGKCIISTTVGAEGIPAKHNEHIKIANSPTEWIATLTELLSNEQEINRIGANAKELALQQFENKSVTAKYLTFAKMLNDKKSRQ